MLQNIGDKLKGESASGGGRPHRWLGYLVLGALVLVFAAWGPYAAVDLSFNQSGYAAKVNGEKITTAEFNQTWQQRLPQLLQAYGGNLSDAQRKQFQQQLLDGAVSGLAANQHARQLGYRVSDAQVVQAFQHEEAFQVDGKFSVEAARARLAAVGMTPETYEADLRRSLLSNQLEATIGATDFFTPAEAKRVLGLLDEEREVRFMLLQPGDFAGSAPVAPEAIEAYYKAHAAEFTQPEYVRLDYAELVLADVAASINVTDAQLHERYEKDKAKLGQQETRHARHILITVDDKTSDAQALAQARDIYNKIKAGGDFAALAKQYSKDSASATAGGDLGWSSRDVYVKEFADKLFSMKEGEVSEPVKTQFGYHVIQLEGIRAASGKSFEDAKAELTQTLRNEMAGTEFNTREDALQERLERGGANLDQLTKEFGLHRGTVERFERGAGGLPLGSDAELNRMVFSDPVLNQHRVGGPAQLGEDHIAVFQVTDHQAPRLRPLDEVRDSIVATLKRERGSAAALAAAQAAADRIKAGATFEQATAAFKGKAEPARFVGRSSPDLPVQLRDAAFAGLRPETGHPLAQAVKMEGGGAAVLEVTASRVQAFSDNPQLQQLRTQRELQRYSLRDVDAYIADVVGKAKVTTNPKVFE